MGTSDAPIQDAAAEPTTDDLLKQILAEQQQHRAEVAALREQVNAQKPTPAPQGQRQYSAEEAAALRADEIALHPFYCFGCGLLYDYQRECRGKPESPHPALDVVSTDELKQEDVSQHTHAPNTDTIG